MSCTRRHSDVIHNIIGRRVPHSVVRICTGVPEGEKQFL